MKHLVIFDVDGTLFQTDRVTIPAVQRTFADYGLPVPATTDILGFFGKSVASYEAWLGEQCPSGKASEIIAATNALELKLIGDEGKLYPGVPDTLAQLTDTGYALAICSNGPQAYVDEVLDKHHLRQFFPTVFARDMQYSGKEEMTRFILDSVAPEQFAIIGDRYDDIEAAHAWKGYGVAATYGYGNEEEWRDADRKISTITQAPECLKELFCSGVN